VTEQHRPKPLPPTAAVDTPPSSWDQFGRHRFRAPIGIVIDAPFPITGGWVAVTWPDPADASGFRRLLWQHDAIAGRGWLIPERLAYADVVEFGSDPIGSRRWYGIVQKYEPGQWLTVQGPFPTPVEAGRAADRLLNPTQHEPEQRIVSHDRSRRDHCHTRHHRPPQ
jgi:hypothetical protein